MADQEPSDNRTEDPTPRRRQKARDEGRIARSTEFAAASLLLAGTMLMSSVAGRSISGRAQALFATSADWLLLDRPSLTAAAALLRGVVFQYLAAMGPLFIGLALVAIAAGLAQTRGVATWKPVQPDLSRISPLTGFKRLLGADAVINLVKSVLKLTLLGLVTYSVLRRSWPEFIDLIDQGPRDIVAVLASSSFRLALTLAFVFMVIGGFDYAVQFFRLEKSLKMSRQEVVQEHRDQEGDPHIKARIRQIARQRARQRMLAGVAHADVVITNPTHLAVALRYDAGSGGAPVVVAMGERKLAERIKKLARAAGVPMVENRPLARALMATCTVGAPIPPALYVAVAEILAYVYRMRQRGFFQRRPEVVTA
ncbi:MAG: flagellar biosynthesis protein FlhB [Gemmatimonadales bacterium]